MDFCSLVFDFVGTHGARSVDGNISTTFRLKPQMITPFSFPVLKPADEKDDGVSYVHVIVGLWGGGGRKGRKFLFIGINGGIESISCEGRCLQFFSQQGILLLYQVLSSM